MATLEQDFITVPGQNYAIISIVGPDQPQKTEQLGIKIRGCFSTRDEANAHAQRLHKDDATFDIYVVDMYKWLLVPPDREKIEDTHYADEKLEEIMTKYKENQAQAARMFQERKKGMMEKPTGDGDAPYITPGDENSKFYTKPDEPPISHPAEVVERLQKEYPDKPMQELVKMADEEIKKEIEERNKQREADAKKTEEAEASTSGEASSSGEKTDA